MDTNTDEQRPANGQKDSRPKKAKYYTQERIEMLKDAADFAEQSARKTTNTKAKLRFMELHFKYLQLIEAMRQDSKKKKTVNTEDAPPPNEPLPVLTEADKKMLGIE